MNDQPINQDGAIVKPRLVLPRVCVGVILLMWVATGFSKVSDISAFVDTISEHKVLPQELYGLVWWVGPGELVMGLLLVFVMGSELTKVFGRLVLLISMSAILGFSYYLSLVDEAVLLESGCGCLEGLRIDFGMEDNERLLHYIINGVLVVLHLIALFGPGVIMRNYKARIAAAEQG